VDPSDADLSDDEELTPRNIIHSPQQIEGHDPRIEGDSDRTVHTDLIAGCFGIQHLVTRPHS
jgi:hypothetical protein